MPSFSPKKDEELVILLKEGEGTFNVLSATERLSKKGDQMIELLLECWDGQNGHANIFDYLIFNDNLFCHRKIKHFCYGVGLQKEYENGKITANDCLGKSGGLLIGIQKDFSGKYPDKNSVSDFLKSFEKVETTPALDKMNDDIPF